MSVVTGRTWDTHANGRQLSLLGLLSHRPRATSSSGSGFGEMGPSSYLMEKRAGSQSQFQSQQGQRQTLEPAQAYGEISILPVWTTASGQPLASLLN